jgi:hypothetical protein
MDPDQVTGSRFERIYFSGRKGRSTYFQRKADPLILVPKWCLAVEGASEFKELSYCIR